MTKEEMIKFVEDALKSEAQMRLIVEVDYRVLTNASMSAKNLNDPVFSKQSEYKNRKDIHDSRIHYLRELLEEIKEDKFTI